MVIIDEYQEEVTHKRTFEIPYGHYEFIVVHFGLTKFTNQIYVFNHYLDKFVLVFLDNILACSKNEKEHEEHIRME